jgi:TolB-like protein/DNA-binding winged helix-turn-helix (wHTH) protein
MAEDPLNAASSASQQLQKASRLRFGPFTLDHQRAELLRDGVVVPLRPKPFLLLSVFAAQPGRVLSKEELLEAAWPGVVVTDDSLTQCVHELRTALGDAGSVLLRTVPRRGYRFDAAVTADPAPATLSPATGASLEIGATGSAAPLLSDARSATSDKETAAALVQPHRRVLLATTVLVLVLVASVAAWLATRGPDSTSSSTPRSELASTPALSVVVLPLAVEDGAKDSEWFADALLGDLTTEVARLQGSFVIARDTAHTYKGRAVDPRTVAKELGVRYVVQGSLRHDGRSIRLNLALIDGTSGAQRWSEKFDFDRAELNKALDDIVSRLARFLSIELWRSAADRSATLSPDQVTADDLAMRAFALWFRGFSRENVNQALALCEQAVARDPNSIRGWGGIAFMNVQAGLNNWAADRAAAFRRVDDAAEPGSARPRRFLYLPGQGDSIFHQERLDRRAPAERVVGGTSPFPSRCLWRPRHVLDLERASGGSGTPAGAGLAAEPARFLPGGVAVSTRICALHARPLRTGARVGPHRTGCQPGSALAADPCCGTGAARPEGGGPAGIRGVQRPPPPLPAGARCAAVERLASSLHRSA